MPTTKASMETGHGTAASPYVILDNYVDLGGYSDIEDDFEEAPAPKKKTKIRSKYDSPVMQLSDDEDFLTTPVTSRKDYENVDLTSYAKKKNKVFTYTTRNGEQRFRVYEETDKDAAQRKSYLQFAHPRGVAPRMIVQEFDPKSGRYFTDTESLEARGFVRGEDSIPRIKLKYTSEQQETIATNLVNEMLNMARKLEGYNYSDFSNGNNLVWKVNNDLSVEAFYVEGGRLIGTKDDPSEVMRRMVEPIARKWGKRAFKKSAAYAYL